MNTKNILEELNPQQRLAAESDARVTKVEAGAGTGKTKMLIGRIQYLLENNRDKVICVSFSTAACEEMDRRLGVALNEFDRKMVDNKTCHAMGHRLIMTHYRELGFSERPKLVRDWELADAYVDYCKSSGLHVPEGNQIKSCLALEAFSAASNKPIDAEMIADKAPVLAPKRAAQCGTGQAVKRARLKGGWTPEQVLHLVDTLHKFRRKFGYFLFQDMITMPEDLPDESFRIFNAGHVVVDECQDLNYAQHRFINRLQKNAYSLTMVGDEAQSIFGFQGAQPEVFKNIQVLYPNAKVFKLETNYRCSQPVLDLANDILKHELQSDIWLIPNEPRPGMGVQFYKNPNANIVEWIENIMAEQREVARADRDFSEVAVLYRAHRHTPLLEIALTNAEIPYILEGKSFFEEPTVEDLLAYFHFFHATPFSAKYETAWTKLIRHKKFLGKKTEDEAREAAKLSGTDILSCWETGFPSACRTASQQRLFRELISDLQDIKLLYEAEDWYELARAAYSLAADSWEDRFSADPWQLKEAVDKANGFVDWVKKAQYDQHRHPMDILKEHQDRATRLKGTKSKGGVRVLTVHKAKGLEWDHVALWNVGPTTFPLAHGEPREERRLCYVGVTRAKRDLAIFVNPEADKVTVDYLTGETKTSSWDEHPILKYVGQDLFDFRAAVRDC